MDVPANALRREDGGVAEQILQMSANMLDHKQLSCTSIWLVILGYRGDMLGNLWRIAISVKKQCEGRTHFTLALRSDGEPDAEDAKRRHRNAAVAERIPVFDELADAARALAAVRACRAISGPAALPFAVKLDPGTSCPGRQMVHYCRWTIA